MPWEPEDIAGAVAVWVADDIAQGDGSAVAAWVDRVAALSAAQATGGKQPLYRTAGVAGQPAVDFDGADDFLRYAAADAVSTASDGSVLAVCLLDNLPSGSARSPWGSNDEGSNLYGVNGWITTTAKLEVEQTANTSANLIRGGTTLATATPYLWEWLAAAAGVYGLRLDGTPEALTVAGGSDNGDWFGATPNRDNFTLGADKLNSESGFLDGKIAVVVVVDGPISPADRAAFYAWVTAKYGITLPAINDDFDQAIDLGVTLPASSSTDNTGYTIEASEPMPSVADVFNSAWWKITPPAGPVAVHTGGSSFDTVLAVYSAAVPTPTFADLVEVGSSDDDSFFSPQSLVGWVADGVSTYYVQAGCFSEDDTGTLAVTALVAAGGLHAGAHLAGTSGAPQTLHAGAHLVALGPLRTLAFDRVMGAARQGGFLLQRTTAAAQDPITIEILDPSAPQTVLGSVVDSFAREFLDELVGSGQFEFSLLNKRADPDNPSTAPMIDNPSIALAARKLLARFSLEGEPVFQGWIQRHQPHYIASGEEANELTVVSGRRVDAWWGRCQVLPTGMAAPVPGQLYRGPRPTQDVAHFNAFMGASDQLFEDDEWPFPSNMIRQDSLWSPWPGQPAGFPDPLAYWITPPDATLTSSVPGTDYYRSLLNPPGAPGSIDGYTIYGVADWVYLDGVTIWSSEQRFQGGPDASRLQKKHLQISAGLHTIGAQISHGAGPTGLLLAIVRDSDGTIVYNSNNNGFWHVLPHPSEAPGATAGKILVNLYVYAAARGRLPLVGGEFMPHLSFDAFVDSAGRPWPRISDVSLKVGDSYDKVLEQLAEAYIDYRWQPAGLQLDAYVYGTMGRLTNVAFSNEEPATANVVDLHGDTQNERATALMVRWGNGDTGGQFILFAAGVPETEHIEGFLTMGDASSETEALLLAVPYLEVVADPHEVLEAQVQPRSSLDTPYKAFRVGDRAELVVPGGSPVTQRNVSIAMKQDDEDWEIDWHPEWRDQAQEYEQRVRTWLSRLGGGGGGGATRLPSSSMPNDPFPKVATTRSYAFGFTDGLSGDTLGPIPVDVRSRVRDLLLRRRSTTGTSTATLALNGTTLLTVTANPGEEFARASLSPPATAEPTVDEYTAALVAGNNSSTQVILVVELTD